MPSRSLEVWTKTRRAALDELRAAHTSIGGTSRGRRFATQQVNRAYAVLLSAEFQGYCRDLHSECADYFVGNVAAGTLQAALRSALVLGRRLDRGNPNPGNIGSDYNRFGLPFWDEVLNLDQRNLERRNRLEELNNWRNAIAHQDFDLQVLGSTTLQLRQVQCWRRACEQLALSFDDVMRRHLETIHGNSPW